MDSSLVASLALHFHPPLGCLAKLFSSSISLALGYAIILVGIIISVTNIVDFGISEAFKNPFGQHSHILSSDISALDPSVNRYLIMYTLFANLLSPLDNYCEHFPSVIQQTCKYYFDGCVVIHHVISHKVFLAVGHSGYFQIFTTLNNASINITVAKALQSFFQIFLKYICNK